jgi:hypothetical protein
MAKLPSSFRSKNRTTEEFREQYARLPEHIKELTRGACVLFDQNPAHPSLRHHPLEDRKTSSHTPGSFSVSISMQYRAIYLVDPKDSVNVWYWIGTHAEYKRFTGSKR